MVKIKITCMRSLTNMKKVNGGGANALGLHQELNLTVCPELDRTCIQYIIMWLKHHQKLGAH